MKPVLLPPYSRHTETILERLALLKPKTVAPMHGPAFAGEGERAIQEYAAILKEVLGAG